MDLFAFDPPRLTPQDARALAAEHWRIVGEAHRLRGERSANFRIVTGDGDGYVLQVQSASERPEAVAVQTAALLHVGRADPDLPVPQVVVTSDGEPLATVELGGRVHLARLVTFLPGENYDLSAPRTPAVHRGIGRLVGRVAAALADFDHPAVDQFMPWDVANGLIVDAALRDPLGPDSRRAIDAIDDRLRAVDALLPTLDIAVVHNDGHAGNLLRPAPGSDAPAGLIDFGDVVRTAVAADVAIVAESFAPDHPDPIAVTAHVCAGYHAVRPLADADLAAVGELVLARAALGILLAEYQSRQAPHLAPEACAALPHLVDRLERWSRLAPTEITDRIHAELTP